MSIQAQRLLNVARAVRESPDPSRFTMSREIHNCGTPACAWGHYMFRDDLQDEFTPYSDYSGFARHRDGKGHLTYASDEVLHHFGITDDEAAELFSNEGCGYAKTALQAATYIERFVAKKWGIDPAVRKIEAALTDAQPESVLCP